MCQIKERLREEEPVTYGRSRVEFVISTAQAQKEGTIGVVLDEAAPQIVQQAEEQCIRAGITKERVRFLPKKKQRWELWDSVETICCVEIQ